MLYPKIDPFSHYYVKVSDLHTLYVEQVGNPDGIPILFLHGGPGSGLDEDHRRFFDPKKFHVILFDQRGCGKSKPYGELKDNTTQDLINDIEKIRRHLKIPTWHVFGGSWGSFLALAYAQTWPAHVSSLILRGLFLGRKREVDFFYQEGASFIFPENYEKFVSILSEKEKKDTLSSFYKRLHSENKDTAKEAAKHWSLYEGSCLKLINTEKTTHDFAKEERIVSLARIETHYFINGCFIEDNQLIDKASILKNIPITLVHGRFDVICPFENAFLFKKKMPHVNLKIAKSSGHSATEPEILEMLLEALDLIK